MERVEVIVVGGGPAGATAARLLARGGARVVLLEARPIPRPKLCGGGLTPKALPYLAGTASEAIERRIDRVELAGSRLGSVHLHLPEAPIAMVERAPFDAALVQAAAAEGADVRDRWAVQDIDAGADGVTVRGPRGIVHGAVLLAADGDPSRIAQRLGIGGEPRRHALALEVDLPFAAGRRSDELQLRFGVRGGYAWYFPKGDHANVGILTWQPRRQPGLRDHLLGYVAELGMAPSDGRIKGHWIPQALRRTSASRGRVLLIGDAAATGDPFFGEGISFAMASAVLAANAVEAWASGNGPLDAYDAALRSTLGPAMRRLTLVSALADRIPTISVAALRFSGWARNEGIRAIVGRGAPFGLPDPTSFPGTTPGRS